MNCELTKFPYFIYPAVEALRSGSISDDESRRLRRLVAANVGHLPSLRLIIGEDPDDFAHFYPDMQTATPSTLDTIDSFIDRFGSKTPKGNAAVDSVASILEGSASAAPYSFTEPVFSEDAAYDCIRNRDYKGALDIFNHIILVNPEKSVYFADQIRFLRKLILNENHKTIRPHGRR